MGVRIVSKLKEIQAAYKAERESRDAFHETDEFKIALFDFRATVMAEVEATSGFACRYEGDDLMVDFLGKLPGGPARFRFFQPMMVEMLDTAMPVAEAVKVLLETPPFQRAAS